MFGVCSIFSLFISLSFFLLQCMPYETRLRPQIYVFTLSEWNGIGWGFAGCWVKSIASYGGVYNVNAVDSRGNFVLNGIMMSTNLNSGVHVCDTTATGLIL